YLIRPKGTNGAAVTCDHPQGSRVGWLRGQEPPQNPASKRDRSTHLLASAITEASTKTYDKQDRRVIIAGMRFTNQQVENRHIGRRAGNYKTGQQSSPQRRIARQSQPGKHPTGLPNIILTHNGGVSN